MIPTDTRSRIAVFIDFDNVEIGVKTTIGGQFDIGLVLEAIKERGEIVTKIAYSDWKRVGDYSRLLTQHAIRMVQRNMTPGGDKNGADITMALDALEMAFTHDHINAFVIVGGDSDFISLVEKLKQYGRKVIVVGGRQFTSLTMQKNCHEFIAYENLVGSSPRSGRSSERGGRPAAASAAVSQALPLVLRALKVLSEREVAPQLGLLKSTLLQLDSTFSEREYGAGSFRDFMEKVAQTGAVTLKHSGRSMLVEAVEDGAPLPVPQAAPEAGVEGAVAAAAPAAQAQRPAPRPVISPVTGMIDETEADEPLPASPMSMQDGIRAVQQAFSHGEPAPRWPMYVRQAKQYLRNTIEGFDERKYGFASVVDLLRAAGKEGVLRIERDRQGAVRVFPGAGLVERPAPAGDAPLDLDESASVEVPFAASAGLPVEEVAMDDVPAEDMQAEGVPADLMEPAAIVEVVEIVDEMPILEAVLAGGLVLDEIEEEPGDVNGNRANGPDTNQSRPVVAPRRRAASAGSSPRGASGRGPSPRAKVAGGGAAAGRGAKADGPPRSRPRRAPKKG